jgi:hypothetical protein
VITLQRAELASNPASSTRNLQNLSTPPLRRDVEHALAMMPIPRCRSIVFDNSDKDREGIEVKHTHAHMRREGRCIIGLLLRRRLPDTVAQTATSRRLGAMAGSGLRGEKIPGGSRLILWGGEKGSEQ